MNGHGTEEGARCNRPISDQDGDLVTERCDGVMMTRTGDNCSCHISPPCGSCIDAPLICTVCEATGDDE